jgi:hypothetical protein
MWSVLSGAGARLRRAWSPMTLPTRLIALAVGTLLPVVLFSLVVVAFLAEGERNARQHGLRMTAAAHALAVEREFHASLTTLTALAASPYLDTPSLPDFHEQARRVVDALPWYDLWLWRTVHCLGPRGRRSPPSVRRPPGRPRGIHRRQNAPNTAPRLALRVTGQ